MLKKSSLISLLHCACAQLEVLLFQHTFESCLPPGSKPRNAYLRAHGVWENSSGVNPNILAELKGGASICYEKVCEEELPPQCTETINLKHHLPWKGGQVRYPLISFNDAYWAPTTARMAGPQSTGKAQVLGRGGGEPQEQVND